MKSIISILFSLALVSWFSLAVNAQDIVITEIMYNSPGEDLEFIEIYNNTDSTYDLTGVIFTEGVNYTFSNMDLASGAFVLLSNNSESFESKYGIPAIEWDSGALNNSGEKIEIQSASGVVLDSLTYEDGGEWSRFADGEGASLVLCDPASDNALASNWQRSLNAIGSVTEGSIDYSDPNMLTNCLSDPIIGVSPIRQSVSEAADIVTVECFIDNPSNEDIEVSVSIGTGSTADMLDFEILTDTIFFEAGSTVPQILEVQIVDDQVEEDEEIFILELALLSGNAGILGTSIQFNIVDNDAMTTEALKIIGLVDGPIGGSPKAIELVAVQDIDNLSLFGIGVANNGGGSDGQEYTFPTGAVQKDICFWVTDDQNAFASFFGFEADYVDTGAGINFNGNDAVELFENGAVIDVYGNASGDAEMEGWENTDTWVYRKEGTGPDGNVFVPENWDLQATNLFDDLATNTEAASPYPVDMCIMTSVEDFAFNPEVKIFPNPTLGELNIESSILWDKIIVNNLLGQECMFFEKPENRMTLNIKNLPPDIYLISFISGQRIYTQKIILH